MAGPFTLDLAPGVHGVRDGFTNWYLVVADDGVTAIDAGLPASWKLLEQLLDRIGRGLQDLRAVVLTHAHFDHVGFAEKARTELGVPVWVHERDVELTRHPLRYPKERTRALYAWMPQTMAIFARMGLSGAFFAPPIGDVRAYTGGDVLDVPGRPVVVPTFGHTPGHCALHLPDRGVVFAGDAIVMLDPYTGMPGPRLVAKAATADSAQARASLDVLAGIDADLVLTGHGDPIRGGTVAAADAARRATQY